MFFLYATEQFYSEHVGFPGSFLFLGLGKTEPKGWQSA